MEILPLVTAIITTHNRLELLRRAIDGVRSQTYANIELIVVDDASSDGTQAYCENQAFRYIRIDKAESKGGNYARNLGIKAAKGEYIAFCDDDDYWLPTKIEKQVAKIDVDTELIHCCRRVEMVDAMGHAEYFDQKLASNLRGDLSRQILYKITVITSAILVSRNLLLEAGLFDEQLGFWQEYELSIRLTQLTKVDFVDEALYVYRINFSDTQRLTNKYHSWRKAVKYIRKKHRSLYSKLSFKDRLRVKRMIATDAIDRSRASGLTMRWYWNRLVSKVLCVIG